MNLHKITNNAIGTIQNNPLASGGTNLIVNNALDTKLNAMGGFNFWLTLWHIGLTPDSDLQMEIVEVTARVSPNNYTITRAQQGTTAQNFVQNSNVGLLWTAGNAHEVLDDADSVAEGTIIVYGSDFLPHLLPVGSNGTILEADSSQTLGVKWGTGSAIPSATGTSTGPGSGTSTQTITHSMGAIPSIIELHGYGSQISSGNGASSDSDGAYTPGNGNQCVYLPTKINNTSISPLTSSSFAIYLEDAVNGNTIATGVVGNLTTTTFDIVWTASANTSSGTVFIWKTKP